MSVEMKCFIWLYVLPASFNLILTLVSFSRSTVRYKYELNLTDFKYFTLFSFTPFLNLIIGIMIPVIFVYKIIK